MRPTKYRGEAKLERKHRRRVKHAAKLVKRTERPLVPLKPLKPLARPLTPSPRLRGTLGAPATPLRGTLGRRP